METNVVAIFLDQCKHILKVFKERAYIIVFSQIWIFTNQFNVSVMHLNDQYDVMH